MNDGPSLKIDGWEDVSYCLECYAMIPAIFWPQHQQWHFTLVKR